MTEKTTGIKNKQESFFSVNKGFYSFLFLIPVVPVIPVVLRTWPCRFAHHERTFQQGKPSAYSNTFIH